MNIYEMKESIAETIRNYNSKGWSPATSTNYSFRDDENTIWVSRSGIDKSQFHAEDFITVDSQGLSFGEYSDYKPSAETLIHCTLYEMFPETKVILHSHSVYPIILSAAEGDSVSFQGYEIQKGFEGEMTHENIVTIPVLANSQNMNEFKELLIQNKDKINHHSFIIHKHGTYAWGRNLFEAKRHLETLDYLCQCELRIMNIES